MLSIELFSKAVKQHSCSNTCVEVDEWKKQFKNIPELLKYHRPTKS